MYYALCISISDIEFLNIKYIVKQLYYNSL